MIGVVEAISRRSRVGKIRGGRKIVAIRRRAVRRWTAVSAEVRSGGRVAIGGVVLVRHEDVIGCSLGAGQDALALQLVLQKVEVEERDERAGRSAALRQR